MKTLTHTAVIAFTLMLPSGAFADAGSDLGSKVAQQGTPQGVAPCMSCHGPDGAGIAPAGYPRIAGLDAEYLAKQLKHNMPLGLGDSLSDQDAWDAAAYMNSHERPQDPRHQGDLTATTEQFHGGRFDYYGQRNAADGNLLGERPSTR